MWTLPNILTLARMALAPVIAILPFLSGYLPKLIALIVFLIAAVSDFYDGRLARERGEITDLGKQLDPLADKLLLVATLIPIYFVTRHSDGRFEFPWWGSFPLWVGLLIVGRETAMTVLRMMASAKGVVIAARMAGKVKTVMQDIFMGAGLGWFAWKAITAEFELEITGLAWAWELFHGTVVAVTLAVSTILTIYSLAVYLYQYRYLFTPATSSGSGDAS